MNYHNAVVRLYEHFYNKKYKSHFKVDLDKAGQRKLVDNFIKLLAQQFGIHSVGYNMICDAISYSFSYWSSKNTKRTISLNWIIGKKTITRWLERKEGTDYYTEQFLFENSIDLSSLKQQLAEQDVQEDKPILDPSEELEKARFTGQAQLYHCSQFTTLYHHKSIICLKCGNRAACKKLLKDTKPRLFSKRGYVKDESI